MNKLFILFIFVSVILLLSYFGSIERFQTQTTASYMYDLSRRLTLRDYLFRPEGISSIRRNEILRHFFGGFHFNTVNSRNNNNNQCNLSLSECLLKPECEVIESSNCQAISFSPNNPTMMTPSPEIINECNSIRIEEQCNNNPHCEYRTNMPRCQRTTR